MIEGLIAMKTLYEYLPLPQYPTYPSGLEDKGNAIFRYAQGSSDYPNLIIVDPIYDNDRNIIMPGYYELVLSDDRQTLVLAQSGKIIAVIPVFKYEEDEEEVRKLRDKKYQKKLAKEKKKQDKINKEKTKTGVPLPEEQVYMNASIEYKTEGRYYLIEYERDRIRAWGAIKK